MSDRFRNVHTEQEYEGRVVTAGDLPVMVFSRNDGALGSFETVRCMCQWREDFEPIDTEDDES